MPRHCPSFVNVKMGTFNDRIHTHTQTGYATLLWKSFRNASGEGRKTSTAIKSAILRMLSWLRITCCSFLPLNNAWRSSFHISSGFSQNFEYFIRLHFTLLRLLSLWCGWQWRRIFYHRPRSFDSVILVNIKNTSRCYHHRCQISNNEHTVINTQHTHRCMKNLKYKIYLIIMRCYEVHDFESNFKWFHT